MSTKALIRIYDEKNKEICTIYKHSGGSSKNMKSLLRQFKAIRIAKGRNGNHWSSVNGMGDLAAEIVAKLKSDSQDIKIIDPEEHTLQEWEYIFKFNGVDKPPTFQIIKK